MNQQHQHHQSAMAARLYHQAGSDPRFYPNANRSLSMGSSAPGLELFGMAASMMNPASMSGLLDTYPYGGRSMSMGMAPSPAMASMYAFDSPGGAYAALASSQLPGPPPEQVVSPRRVSQDTAMTARTPPMPTDKSRESPASGKGEVVSTTSDETSADRANKDHYSNRVCVPVSIEQDENWLSELQCFTREHIMEVCWANREDVAVRNASKKVQLDQVGIRCRYCCHKPPGSRAVRSSAFPSSIPQLYQSFTMMLRDHFDNCTSMPSDIKSKYLKLKSSTCQGATDAKKYWSYAAEKLGMVDSEEGIIMNDTTRAAADSIHPFGTTHGETAAPLGCGPCDIVKPADREKAPKFLCALVSHFQKIELLPSERKGNRKSLRPGLPGFGCKHCTEVGRFGMSRVFPARRRTLPARVEDMYQHIRRCNLCPAEAKMTLARLQEEERQDPPREKKFLDLVWERLGHNQANP